MNPTSSCVMFLTGIPLTSSIRSPACTERSASLLRTAESNLWDSLKFSIRQGDRVAGIRRPTLWPWREGPSPGWGQWLSSGLVGHLRRGERTPAPPCVNFEWVENLMVKKMLHPDTDSCHCRREIIERENTHLFYFKNNLMTWNLLTYQ